MEGAVGSYWGVYDVNRKPKFEFTAPIVRVPEWHILAADLRGGVAAAAGAPVPEQRRAAQSRPQLPRARGVRRRNPRGLGHLRLHAAVHDRLERHRRRAAAARHARRAARAARRGARVGRGALGRRTAAASGAPQLRTERAPPKVSIHVPAYNEPPGHADRDARCAGAPRVPGLRGAGHRQQHRATKRLAAGRGALRRRSGARFRFFHVAPLEGFKAGALNYALARTAADAQIVAVIDSDYVVDPRWLRDLTPAFQDQRIAIVQAPQDYRDADQSAFKAMCYAEYRGFFHIGMITRNERNAIIQHGTMTMVRRAQLQELPLGRVVHHRGCRARAAYLRARLRRHLRARELRPRPHARHLHRLQEAALPLGLRGDADPQGARAYAVPRRRPAVAGQRYHFIAGWLPWVADGCNMLFNLAALGWSAAMVLGPAAIDPPLVMYSVLPLSLFTFKLAKLVHLYRVRVGANLRQTARGGHRRTCADPHHRHGRHQGAAHPQRAVLPHAQAGHELGPGARAGGGARGDADDDRPAGSRPGRSRTPAPRRDAAPDRSAWIIVLLVQSVPYASSLMVSLASAFPLPARLLGTGYRPLSSPGEPAPAVASKPPEADAAG